MTDPSQFELFMRKYQAMVFTTAVRLLGNEADAEDISQVVFLKAYEHFDHMAQNPAAGGWLKAVATNLSLNHLTRYRSRWKLFTDLSSEDSETDYVDSLPAPPLMEKELAEADYHEMLHEAMKRLPTSQRVPLVLYHYQDLSYEEIAARLRVSLSKVKIDIHRGRLALARYLKPGLLNEEPRPAQAPVRPPRVKDAPASDSVLGAKWLEAISPLMP